MSFGSPYLLAGLGIVPLLVLAYVLVERRRRAHAAGWSTPALLPNMVRRPRRWFRHLPAALVLLGVAVLLVGFARPQRASARLLGGHPTVVLAFDVSGSMAATDVRPTRIAAARTIAAQLIRLLPAEDGVAVLTFGNTVHVVVPPTLDRQAAIARLPNAVTARAGTSIGDAVAESAAIVVQTIGTAEPGLIKPGALVVLSDGDQTGGGTTPANAATIANSDGVPVDTVAVGTPRGIVTQPFRVNGLTVRTMIPVPADPDTMRGIAQQSGGSFFAVGSPADVPSVSQQLARTFDSLSAPVQLGNHVQSLTALVGAVGLAVILLGVAVSGVWFGRPA